ncbi:hypothetical protein COL00_32545, partial [Bacillus cereus]
MCTSPINVYEILNRGRWSILQYNFIVHQIMLSMKKKMPFFYIKKPIVMMRQWALSLRTCLK